MCDGGCHRGRDCWGECGLEFFTSKNNQPSRQGVSDFKKVLSLVVVMIGVETWKRFLHRCFGGEQRVVVEWRIVRIEENSTWSPRSLK
jgi:hypothetical protein